MVTWNSHKLHSSFSRYNFRINEVYARFMCFKFISIEARQLFCQLSHRDIHQEHFGIVFCLYIQLVGIPDSITIPGT